VFDDWRTVTIPAGSIKIGLPGARRPDINRSSNDAASYPIRAAGISIAEIVGFDNSHLVGSSSAVMIAASCGTLTSATWHASTN